MMAPISTPLQTNLDRILPAVNERTLLPQLILPLPLEAPRLQPSWIGTMTIASSISLRHRLRRGDPLNVHDPAILEDWKVRTRAHEITAIPIDVIVRIGCVLSIYASLVTLLSHERSAHWIHAPNNGSIFGGSSALAKMTSGKLKDLDSVADIFWGTSMAEPTTLSQAPGTSANVSPHDG
jgi:hypothetical protein